MNRDPALETQMRYAAADRRTADPAERAERERDELRETVSDLAATYQVQYAAAYQEAERRLDEAVKEQGALLPVVRHVAGLVAPESGFEYAQIHRQLIYDARAALASIEAQSERGAEHHDG